MKGFAGRLYFGYGDGGENTGPIVISSYDPATRIWADHLTFGTEVVGRFQQLSGSLWAPALDPQQRSDVGYAVGDPSHAWAEHPLRLPPTPAGRSAPLHIFDAAGRGATEERFLSGATYTFDGPVATATASVVRFTAEAGWTASLSVSGASVSRFYNIADLDQKLYTVLGGLAGRSPSFQADYDIGEDSYVYDGERWARGPKLDGFIKPLHFAGALVYRSEDGGMRSFDGEEVTRLAISDAVDHDVEGGTLVVLSRRTVHSTVDLRHWRAAGIAPVTATAIGLLRGVCYLGTSGGEIYQLALGP